MRNTVTYEWNIEYADEHGDIQDHNHSDTLQGYQNELRNVDGGAYQLVLVCSVGNEDEGLQERSWAYVQPEGDWWKLPNSMDCGRKIPQRFHAELAKAK